MLFYFDESNCQIENGSVHAGGETRYLTCQVGKKSSQIASLPENFKIIPDNETASRAKDLIQSGSDLLSVFRRKIKKVKDQGSTNYCHAFAAASAIEMQRALQGEAHVEMSPSFIGNLVTNFQNAGAFIEEDLEVAIKHGCCTTEFVPEINLSRRWYNENKEATLANAALHKIDGWVNLGYAGQGTDLAARVRTCLLQRIPVVVHLGWLPHAVLYLRVEPNGDWNWLNSWNESWGDKGCAITEKRKGAPYAAWVPYSCIASLL